MSDHDRIEAAVYRAVDELNKQLPKGTKIEKSLDSELYGKSGKLESLDFVTFIMEVEEQMQEEFGIDLVITDDELLSKEKSPFQTLGTLTQHLNELLRESGSKSEI